MLTAGAAMRSGSGRMNVHRPADRRCPVPAVVPAARANCRRSAARRAGASSPRGAARARRSASRRAARRWRCSTRAGRSAEGLAAAGRSAMPRGRTAARCWCWCRATMSGRSTSSTPPARRISSSTRSPTPSSHQALASPARYAERVRATGERRGRGIEHQRRAPAMRDAWIEQPPRRAATPVERASMIALSAGSTWSTRRMAARSGDALIAAARAPDRGDAALALLGPAALRRRA